MSLVVAIMIAIIGFGIGAAWIVSLFIRDYRIAARGHNVRALVEDVRILKHNESDSVTIRCRLSWQEGEHRKSVESTETIPVHRSAEVQAGLNVIIRYLDDDNLQFVFD